MSDPLLTITSREDAVELILTQDTVRMKLSEAILEQFRKEVSDDPDVQAPGLIGKFVRAVTGAAGKLLSTSIEYPIYDIASVEDRAGTLVFTYLRRQHPSFEDISMSFDDKKRVSALAAFAPADAAAFAERFATLKAQS